MDPCLIFGYNSVDKITGIIFISRQEILRNIEPTILWSSVNILGTHLAETLDIPKISVRIVCTAPKLMPTSLAILRKSHLLSHISRLCTISTYSSVVASLGRSDLSSSSIFFLPRLNSAAHFYSPCYRRRLIPKCFHEVFVNFLGSHSLLTKTDILSPLSLQLSPFCKFDALSSLNTAVQKQSSVIKCFLLTR